MSSIVSQGWRKTPTTNDQVSHGSRKAPSQNSQLPLNCSEFNDREANGETRNSDPNATTSVPRMRRRQAEPRVTIDHLDANPHAEYGQADADTHNRQQNSGHGTPRGCVVESLLFPRTLAKRICPNGMVTFCSIHNCLPRLDSDRSVRIV